MKLTELPPLDASLTFPKPPFRMEPSILESPPDPTTAVYLQQIRDWRATVLVFLRGPDAAARTATHGLSRRACLALETFLSTFWSENMNRYAVQSPYSLAPFPAAALESTTAPSVETLLQVFRWRAGTVDYLDDVWDVVNEPFLDLDECIAMDRFLCRPSPESVCHLCLTEFADDRLHPDRHECVLLRHVRAKWPAIPIFERWKDEASRAQES